MGQRRRRRRQKDRVIGVLLRLPNCLARRRTHARGSVEPSVFLLLLRLLSPSTTTATQLADASWCARAEKKKKKKEINLFSLVFLFLVLQNRAREKEKALTSLTMPVKPVSGKMHALTSSSHRQECAQAEHCFQFSFNTRIDWSPLILRCWSDWNDNINQRQTSFGHSTWDHQSFLSTSSRLQWYIRRTLVVHLLHIPHLGLVPRGLSAQPIHDRCRCGLRFQTFPKKNRPFSRCSTDTTVLTRQHANLVTRTFY